MHCRYAALVSALSASIGIGQTLLDLRTQAKSVDFSAANTTKPFKSGTTLPATCSVGEAFFKTNAPAGANLYACAALNSWSLETGVTALSGDVSGPAGANVVNQIQGRAVSTTAPTNGQTLVWNATTSRWEPQPVPTGPAGPAGPQGPVGATGPQGAAGPAGANGLNGAIARVQNAGTNLPVEATLNFTGGGCTDDAANGRTNCSGAAGISGLNIAVDGVAQGTQATLNFVSGNGITETCTNNSGASRVDCAPSLNTAFTLTNANAQANKPWFCNSTNGTIALTCSLNASAALTTYTTGMWLLVRSDTTSNGSTQPTLNVDSVGLRNIAQPDGSTIPAAGMITAGRAFWVWYDGAAFRLIAASGAAITSPNSSMVVGGSPSAPTLDVSTSYLNGLYPQLAAANLFGPGFKQTFSPSTTTAASRIVPGAMPSALAAGDLCVSTTGVFCVYDGANINWYAFIAGSGGTPPSAPGAGLAHFAGGTFGMTSSPVVNADIANATIDLAAKVTNTLPVGNGGNGISGAPSRTVSVQVAGCNNSTASSSLDLPTTNAPIPVCHGTTYTWATLDFDHASAKKASLFFRIPIGWTGNIDVGLDWYTSATTNTNAWTLETACLAEGVTDATTPSFNAAQTITTTSNGIANILTRSSQAAITTTGCSAGNILILRVGRDVTDTNTSTDSLQNIDVTLRVTPQA